MKILSSVQTAELTDPVRSKISMVIPVLEATLHSLPLDRTKRLGGVEKITLHDLAREFRDGSGDAGICFEYSVHDAIANGNKLIQPLASEVLEDLCRIRGEAESLLFGPEKDGRIPIHESVDNALTEDAVVYVGNAGRPPKLKRYIPQIINAFRRNEARNRLPRSISGLWKADLFLGNSGLGQWVGTTVKVNADALEGARGLRIGIYPQRNPKDRPRKDDTLNLIRLPLPYDGAFMEVYYKSFFLTRAFIKADAKVPPPVALPDSEDRLVTSELERRREFPILDVLDVLRGMAQPDLIESAAVETITPDATISAEGGLDLKPGRVASADAISLTPLSRVSK